MNLKNRYYAAIKRKLRHEELSEKCREFE